MINLNQFNHLVALAQECHFAQAAARVHLSQPAFSRSIQAAERQVGLRLFERQPGTVRLTPAGEFVIEKARRLLFDARCLERDIDLYRESGLGDTAFGLGPFPAATVLSELLTHIRKEHPRVGVQVEINNWQQLLESLIREDIEFFVAATAEIAKRPTLQIEPLMRQQVNLYVRQKHPLKGVSPSLAEVFKHGLAATKLTPAVRNFLSKMLGLDSEAQLPLALQCDDIDMLHHTALTTDTVIVSTDMAVSKKGLEKKLRVLDVRDFPATYVEMGIVRLRNRTLSPMAKEILRVLKLQVESGSDPDLELQNARPAQTDSRQ
jgi:DNA-binding transcriptional LysR family regulator